ncbi:MAG: GIY-YIG nuclease family protein [Proteobacteria bacterium]|nr:GIY-YIG nuclease family protein [Pseudomonadota bacterium]
MSDREKFKAKVKEYQIKQLNLKETKFKISDPFDLVEDWDCYYPFCDEPGIYAIFDEKWNLLYIGKASNNSSIGARLGTYFKNDEEGNYKPVDSIKSWGGEPHYIIAVSVCKPFEAPSLEEYLIYNLDPKSNKVGKNIQ